VPTLSDRHGPRARELMDSRAGLLGMIRQALAPRNESASGEWVSAVVLVALLIGPLFVAALINPAGVPLFWPVYGLSLVALPIVLFRTRARPLVIVTALFGWLAINKFAVALIARTAAPTVVVWLLNYKEAMYLALFAVGVWSAARLVRRAGRSPTAILGRVALPDWLAIGFLALVTLYFAIAAVINPSDLRGELIYARRFASLPILFLAGRLLPTAQGQFNRALRYVVIIAVAVAAFGLIEWIILGDRFWTDIIHVDALHASLLDEGALSDRSRLVDGMPATWISFFDTFTIRRLVSTFMEPTTLALFLGFALCLGAFVMPHGFGGRGWTWAATLVILGAALALTMGKAGVMVAVLTSVVVLIRTNRRTAARVAGLLVLIAGIGIIVGVLLPLGDNVMRHLHGLASGAGQILSAPFGTGLGTTGFWGERVSIGTDSTEGAIASQLGLLGLFLYAGWWAVTAWQLLPTEANDGAETVRRVFAGAVYAFLAASFVSNSTSGLLGGVWFALLAGWLLSHITSPADHEAGISK
jgi:hypothetical protein